MAERAVLLARLEQWLAPALFRDYCPNGLQVEGRPEIGRLATAVTASQAVIDQAVDWEADALLVHHGWFWKNEAPALTGVKYRRVRALIQAGVNLIAYHLPLDCHPELGNNAQLAFKLGIQPRQQYAAGGTENLLWVGEIPSPCPLSEWGQHVANVLGRAPVLVEGHNRPIRTIAWCTGAAQGFIEQAASLGADAFLSGEISEPTWHLARELGIHYIAAGHHATERYGVQAIGARLATELCLQHRFFDEPNPV